MLTGIPRWFQAASRFAREQSEVVLPFFREDERNLSLLGLEALETIVRFLFVLADDERKLVKVRSTASPRLCLSLNDTSLYRIRNPCSTCTRRSCDPRLFGSWQETMPSRTLSLPMRKSNHWQIPFSVSGAVLACS